MEYSLAKPQDCKKNLRARSETNINQTKHLIFVDYSFIILLYCMKTL